MKRSPLTRTTGLQRSRDPLARATLNPVSERRRSVNRKRVKVLRQVWGPRSEWRCALRGVAGESGIPACFGPVNAHEILTRARAGRTDANLLDIDGMIPLCDRHNEYAGTDARAYELGILKHSWDAR